MQSAALRRVILSSYRSPEVRQYLARVPQMSLSDGSVYVTLIDGLVRNGLWNKTDTLWIAGADEATSKINLKSSSFPITIGVQPTFTAYQGWAGNGSSQYLGTGFVPSTAGGVFTQDSNHFGAYIRTSRALADYASGGFKNTVADAFMAIYPYVASGAYGNNHDQVNAANTVASSDGHYINTRTASNAVAMYKNGASVGTRTDASVGAIDAELYLLAAHNDLSIIGYSADQHAAFHLGSGLTAGEAATYSLLVNAALTSFGTNVY